MMKPKILLIEDDKGVRENISELLLEEGFEVDSFSNGKDLLSKIGGTTYDLIICDIMLPVKNGFLLFNELKEFYLDNIPPFIFLTARVERDDLRKGMELGADDYITKPYTRQDILNSIKTQLGKRKKVLSKILIEERAASSENEKDSSVQSRLNYESSLFLDKGGSPTLIKISEIAMIKSQRDYSQILTVGGLHFTIKRTMKKWESILPADKFLRIHRSTIINLEHIRKFDKWFNYTYKVTIKGIQEPVFVSQRYSLLLRRQVR